MLPTKLASMSCKSARIALHPLKSLTACACSYVRGFEGADIRVNGETLVHAHLYEQMPAESQFEETIYVTRNANKYSFDFKLGFRSRCEREGQLKLTI